MEMNELYSRLYSLEEELDKLPIFEEIDEIVNKIKENEELMNKIKRYHEMQDEKLRRDIYSYQEIKEYKEKETDINLFILEMNRKINNRLLKKDGCIHESH